MKTKVCIVTDDTFEAQGAFSLFSDAAVFKGKLEQSYSPQGPLPPYHIIELEVDARKVDKVRPFWQGSICVKTGEILEVNKYVEVSAPTLDDFEVTKSPGDTYIIVKSFLGESHCKGMLQVALEHERKRMVPA